MLPEAALKDLLHERGRTQIEALLLCLAVEAEQPKSVSQIKALAKNAGLRKVQNWNISGILSGSKGKALRTNAGWELGSAGKQQVAKIAGTVADPIVPRVASSLRSHLVKLKDPQTAAFVDEAVRCFEAKLYRAAVVLSWVGAVSLLYGHVIKNELSAFNTEAKRRNTKWKDAKKSDDLTRMKESDFLDVLEAISVIGKSIKQELKVCLRLRNGCGHPSSLRIAEHKVASHIEILILNVFAQFG